MGNVNSPDRLNLLADGVTLTLQGKQPKILSENQDWRLGKTGRYAIPITSKQIAEEK
jgi:hypothetical protein